MPTPPDDVLLNKAAIIERCIRRIREEHAACPALDDSTRVDALTLNIERACQAAIDMAMHLGRARPPRHSSKRGGRVHAIGTGGLGRRTAVPLDAWNGGLPERRDSSIRGTRPQGPRGDRCDAICRLDCLLQCPRSEDRPRAPMTRRPGRREFETTSREIGPPAVTRWLRGRWGAGA